MLNFMIVRVQTSEITWNKHTNTQTRTQTYTQTDNAPYYIDKLYQLNFYIPVNFHNLSMKSNGVKSLDGKFRSFLYLVICQFQIIFPTTKCVNCIKVNNKNIFSIIKQYLKTLFNILGYFLHDLWPFEQTKISKKNIFKIFFQLIIQIKKMLYQTFNK